MSAATELRVRIINHRSRSCDTCGKQLCDCNCVASAACMHCEIDYGSAVEFSDTVCVESPDGLHHFKSTERDP